MLRTRPLRVLHCPTSVGGNPQGLARAERSLGIQSTSLSIREHYLCDPTDVVLWRNGESPIIAEFRRWRWLWRAMRDFDLIHFNFGKTLFPWRTDSPISVNGLLAKIYGVYARMLQMKDLPLLREAGRAIVVTYQGDDARQGDYCLRHFDISIAHHAESDYYTPLADRRRREAIAVMAQYADRIYAVNPDLLHVLPAGSEFVPYASVDPREWTPVKCGNDVPVVLHAPSHRGAKGTKFVLQAVDRLRREGVRFEFLLLENVPHTEVRRMYERADLLVDQLLAGWYGALAVELMALGKPVICYIREDDLRFIPPGMKVDLPLILATPYTIYEVLKTWLTDRRHELREVGDKGRAYVERWHDPVKIAAKLIADYEIIVANK